MILRVKRRKYAHGHLDYCTSSPKQGPLDCLNPLDLGLIQVDDQDLKKRYEFGGLDENCALNFFLQSATFYDYFVIWFAGMYLSWHKNKELRSSQKKFKNLPEKRKQKYLSTNLIPKDQNVRKNHQKRMFLSKWATNIWKKTTKHSDITVQNHRAQS